MVTLRGHPFSRFRPLLLFSAALLLICLLLFSNPLPRPPPPSLPGTSATACACEPPPPPVATTAVRHLLFGIASSAKSWPHRRQFLRLWWRPGLTRGLVFLDSTPGDVPGEDSGELPPVRVSADVSRFPYSFKGGLRSAVRVARIAKELVDAVEGGEFPGEQAEEEGVRWVVLGDDDTVFVPENLAGTLARYDWRDWYYIGGLSENVLQNMKHSFGMAFGGGGLAISYPLARVLARFLDSCLMRYPNLYGSDARIFACLAELGVELTHEPGFHQVDLFGDLFGLLSAHPLSPLISLHHLDNVDPIFPGMNRTMALRHLFEAVNVDPSKILQQTVCYDRLKNRTVSVSWGYAIQLFEGNQMLPYLLSVQRTFSPWRRSRNAYRGFYMFNTRELPKELCERPAVFFLESIISDKHRVESNYSRHAIESCLQNTSSAKNLQQIRVSSQQLDHQIGQARRRHCCDVLPTSSETVMYINIRKCVDDELIAMHP